MSERNVASTTGATSDLTVSRMPLVPYVVFACSLVFFWSISARALIYTLMPTIANDLGFSSSVAGLVISVLLFGYGAGGWSTGWLPGSRKTRILAGVLLSLPATAAMSQVNGFLSAAGVAFVLGYGIGVYLPLGMALIVDVGHGGRGAAYMSIHEFSATLASFTGSAMVALLLAWTDWHGSILLWCVVGVLATASFIAVRDPEGDERHVQKVREPVQLDFKLFSAVFSYGVGTMLVMGLVSMLALIMVRAWGLSQAEAATVLGGTRLAGIIGVGIVGLMADRLGHGRVLIGLQSTALAGLVLMSLDGFSPVFVAGVLLLAIGASGNITLNPVVVAEAFPPEKRERVMAYATGPGGLGGMVLAPTLFGVMLDAGLATGPILFAAAATLAAIFVTGRISSHD